MASIRRKRPTEGTVYPRKDGRWIAQLPIPGRPSRPQQRYARTEEEGWERLAEMIRDRDAGKPVVGRALRVDRYLDAWLAERSEWGERKPLSAGSLAQYRSLVELYLKPELGQLRLADLRREHIADALRRIQRRRVRGGGTISPNTVGAIQRCLRSALASAVESERIADNPAARLRSIKEQVEILGPSRDECAAILAALEDEELYPLFLLLRWTGCRVGEALGLRRMDLGEGQVIFRKQGGGGDLKTERSVRPMPLPDSVRAAIAAFPVRSPYHVFTTATGRPVDRQRVRRVMARALLQTGIEPPAGADNEAYSPKGFRHAFATELVQAGFSYGWVGILMGHTSEVQVRNHYGHLRPRLGVIASPLADFYRHPADLAVNQ